ncbi:Sugar/inositol transporter,Major facilitator superfamily domain,Major facilitator, sugar transporter- [Cinara cedri]|uniref:Sugar/inositol transporter,Major facilitator superfamily domain,Major facilitator, sugar transporter n=1 Tax=Cinara cedri TaxID=506608 RepID=A0A5E4M1T0_9HEMI|nr:Sugar/inositol transporter,Major facilitator superfamily domain,Major facilitator, sugar transporter- [Cinara cedri]
MPGGSKEYDEIPCSNDEEMKPSKSSYNEKSSLLDKSAKTSITTRKWTQYLAALIVTIGGFIMGTTLGWTSPAGPMMKNNQYKFHVAEENVSWIASFMALGAMIGCPVMAVLVHKLGNIKLMIILTVPTLLGWTMIIWAKSVTWIYVGRILTGFASGSYSVIVPQYTSEIAEKEIRGTLGTYFQLQVFSGILFTYFMGSYLNVFGLSFACAIVPIIYINLLFFLPESPMFHLIKGDVNKAVLSLNFFYGSHGQVDHELYILQKSLTKTKNERLTILQAFQTTAAKRGLFLGIGIMIFQQFTGANAVIFYTTTIFDATGSTISSNTSTIIVGVMAVLSTYFSTLVIDRLGRKILLLYSVVAMGITTFLIGGFFYAKDTFYDVSSIGYVPLVSLCVFIVMFSIGFGPIPWMMMGEIFPTQIKGIASSIVCMSNWFFVFLVTKFYSSLVSAIFIYNTFWLFTLFCVVGTFFVIYFVPETKGKTIDEIQELLSA